MTRKNTSIEVRAAGKQDVEAIARLAGELGYPSTPAQVGERLAVLEGDLRNAILIAATRSGEVVGWIQVTEVRTLATDPRAEIRGLVVDSSNRGAGVGRLLVESGEAWARERGLATIGLHSNILRDRAHEFYVRLGYAVTKSQKVFRKIL